MNEAGWHALSIVTVVVLLIGVVVVVGVLRELGSILMQVGPARYREVEDEGPKVGTPSGIDAVSPGRSQVVLFLAPSCDLCKPIADALPLVGRHYSDIPVIPAVVGQEGDETRSRYAATLGSNATISLRHLFVKWNVPGTPFAVGIDAHGQILLSGIVNNLPQLETFMGTIQRWTKEQPVEAPDQYTGAESSGRNLLPLSASNGDPS